MSHPRLRAAAVAFILLLLPACKSEGQPECKAGESDCECREDDACDPGLACNAGLCEPASSTSTSTGDTTAEPTTEPVDPCMGACAEGQVCEDGACAWPFECSLTCTDFSDAGVCYCQTTCAGSVEIFTCSDEHQCACQGGNRPYKLIEAECTSMEAAMEIYYRCHRV